MAQLAKCNIKLANPAIPLHLLDRIIRNGIADSSIHENRQLTLNICQRMKEFAFLQHWYFACRVSWSDICRSEVDIEVGSFAWSLAYHKASEEIIEDCYGAKSEPYEEYMTILLCLLVLGWL